MVRLNLADHRPAGRHRIRNRLPASAELTLLGLVVSVAIAIPLGVLAATRPGSWIDHLCRITTTGRRIAAGVLYRAGAGLFYFRLGWSPAPLGRLDAVLQRATHRDRSYLIDSLIAREFETFRSALSQLFCRRRRRSSRWRRSRA